MRDVANVRRKLPSEKTNKHCYTVFTILYYALFTIYYTLFCQWVFFLSFFLCVQCVLGVFFKYAWADVWLPLMLLWNSCGRMPLGASWWSTQRRNCLATPAALPGISMLKLSTHIYKLQSTHNNIRTQGVQPRHIHTKTNTQPATFPPGLSNWHWMPTYKTKHICRTYGVKDFFHFQPSIMFFSARIFNFTLCSFMSFC